MWVVQGCGSWYRAGPAGLDTTRGPLKGSHSPNVLLARPLWPVLKVSLVDAPWPRPPYSISRTPSPLTPFPCLLLPSLYLSLSTLLFQPFFHLLSTLLPPAVNRAADRCNSSFSSVSLAAINLRARPTGLQPSKTFTNFFQPPPSHVLILPPFSP